MLSKLEQQLYAFKMQLQFTQEELNNTKQTASEKLSNELEKQRVQLQDLIKEKEFQLRKSQLQNSQTLARNEQERLHVAQAKNAEKTALENQEQLELEKEELTNEKVSAKRQASIAQYQTRRIQKQLDETTTEKQQVQSKLLDFTKELEESKKEQKNNDKKKKRWKIW